MTYTDYIIEYISSKYPGEPIYLDDIVQNLSSTYEKCTKTSYRTANAAMNRIMRCRQCPSLRKYQKGIYYLAEKTDAGEGGINRGELIYREFMAHSSGYDTGLSAMHQMGLIANPPEKRMIATNRIKHGFKTIDAWDVVVCAPRIEITARNKDYLQLLDVMEMMDQVAMDAVNPYEILAGVMRRKCLDSDTLLDLGTSFYYENTTNNAERTLQVGIV